MFLSSDGLLSGEGGASLAGQITGRPDVSQPTSLSLANCPAIRLEALSYEPLGLRKGGDDVASWRSQSLTLQGWSPLRRGGPWVLGLQVTDTGDDLYYRDPVEGKDYSASSDVRRWTLAAAYQWDDWTFGAGLGRGESDVSAAGASLAEHLQLPANTTLWPAYATAGWSTSVGAARRAGAWQWGLQYRLARPDDLLKASYEHAYLTAPGQARADRWDFFGTRQTSTRTYFLSGWSSAVSREGPLLTGLMQRGRLDTGVTDWSIAVGRRSGDPRRLHQWTLDWRDSSAGINGEGFAGLLPGIAGEIFLLDGAARVRTLSLRHGLNWPISRKLTGLCGLSLHHSLCTLNWLVRKVPALGQSPVVVDEERIKQGVLDMLGVTLGVRLEEPQWTASLALSGLAAVTRGFSERQSVSEPDLRPNRVRLKPMLNAAVTYRF